MAKINNKIIITCNWGETTILDLIKPFYLRHQWHRVNVKTNAQSKINVSAGLKKERKRKDEIKRMLSSNHANISAPFQHKMQYIYKKYKKSQ